MEAEQEKKQRRDRQAKETAARTGLPLNHRRLQGDVQVHFQDGELPHYFHPKITMFRKIVRAARFGDPEAKEIMDREHGNYQVVLVPYTNGPRLREVA